MIDAIGARTLTEQAAKERLEWLTNSPEGIEILKSVEFDIKASANRGDTSLKFHAFSITEFARKTLSLYLHKNGFKVEEFELSGGKMLFIDWSDEE